MIRCMMLVAAAMMAANSDGLYRLADRTIR